MTKSSQVSGGFESLHQAGEPIAAELHLGTDESELVRPLRILVEQVVVHVDEQLDEGLERVLWCPPEVVVVDFEGGVAGGTTPT